MLTEDKSGTLVIYNALRKELGIVPYQAFIMKVILNEDGVWQIEGKVLQ